MTNIEDKCAVNRLGEMMKPLISVIMSVHNTREKYLREAIESILQQTYDNFEFIVINDASTDNSLQVINSYNDPRIVLINNSYNLGLTKSLNIGLEIAKGKYVARMDSDDISLENRFEKQLEFMEKRLDIGVLGAMSAILGSNKYHFGYISRGSEELKIRMLFYNATFSHSLAFIRKQFLVENNIKYNEGILKSQDYELWSQCVKYGVVHSLPEVLLLYRIHDDQISTQKKDEQNYYVDKIRTDSLEFKFKCFSLEEIKEFLDLNFNQLNVRTSVKNNKNVLLKIINENKKNKYFKNGILKKELLIIWTYKGLKRFKKIGKLDFFLDPFSLNLLVPTNIIYLMNFFIIDQLKIRRIIKVFKVNYKN